MTTRNVLVTGATGQQGGGVARNLLTQEHNVTALVRDPEAEKSLALKALGAELVQGDFGDRNSLLAALDGVESVFAVGTPSAGIDAEISQGKALADAAVEAGVNHYVYSSVAGAQSKSGIPHFDSKAEVEDHITTTNLNWSIVAPVFFMDNVLFPWNTAGLARGVFRQAMDPATRLQSISVSDIGKFNAAVIDGGEKFFGKRIEIAGDELTGPQMAEAMALAIESEIRFEQQPFEELGAPGTDMLKMYEWFGTEGFSADIESLRATYPEIGWTPFAEWTAAIDWNSVLPT